MAVAWGRYGVRRLVDLRIWREKQDLHIHSQNTVATVSDSQIESQLASNSSVLGQLRSSAKY